jgi:hypothetical protein
VSYFEAGRRPRKRSLQNVNEHFEGKPDAEIASLGNFYLCQYKSRKEDCGCAENDSKIGMQRCEEAHPRNHGKTYGYGNDSITLFDLMAYEAQEEEAQHSATKD